MTKPKNKRAAKQHNAALKIERESQRQHEQLHKRRVLKWQVLGFAVLLLATFGAWGFETRVRLAQEAKRAQETTDFNANYNVEYAAWKKKDTIKQKRLQQDVDSQFAQDMKQIRRESEMDPLELHGANTHSEADALLAEAEQLSNIADAPDPHLRHVAASSINPNGSTPNNVLFNGQQQDATGLYYLRNRYYNPSTGRFLSHDPMLGHSEDPASLHRYTYASADPVNYIDPNGLESISSVTTSMGIATSLRSMKTQTDMMVLQDVSDMFGGPEFSEMAFLGQVWDNFGDGDGSSGSVDEALLEDDLLSQYGNNGTMKAGGTSFPVFPDFLTPIIVDQNSNFLTKRLKRLYPNVIELPFQQSVPDPDIIARARRDNAIILTNNAKDFKDYEKVIRVSRPDGTHTGKKSITRNVVESIDEIRVDPDFWGKLERSGRRHVPMEGLTKHWRKSFGFRKRLR